MTSDSRTSPWSNPPTPIEPTPINDPGGRAGPPEQADTTTESARPSKQPGERLSGAEIAELERAHAHVLEAEERASHPQASPLARALLAAAQEAEQEMLDQLGFTSYSGTTASAFRIRFPSPPTAPDALDPPVPGALSPVRHEVSNAQPPETIPTSPAPADRHGAQRGTPQMPDAPVNAGRPSNWSEPASEPDQASPLAKLRAGAAEFVEAEIRRAQASAAEIVEAARTEARTTTDLAKRLEETATAASAATAGDLLAVLGLIDDLTGKLGSAQGDVRSRVDVLRMASGKLQQPSSGRPA